LNPALYEEFDMTVFNKAAVFVTLSLLAGATHAANGAPASQSSPSSLAVQPSVTKDLENGYVLAKNDLASGREINQACDDYGYGSGNCAYGDSRG
jgi:hypothetical protein